MGDARETLVLHTTFSSSSTWKLVRAVNGAGHFCLEYEHLFFLEKKKKD